MDRYSLWKLVISEKYGSEEGGWCTLEARGSYGVSLWKHISKGWIFFRENIKLLVGCGSKILFWHDHWCGERPLRLEFPLLFSLAQCKDAWVANCVEGGSRVVFWNVHFERTVNDWEMDDCSVFYSLLYSKAWRRGRDDKLLWLSSKNGVFSVKSMYGVLLRGSNVGFPWLQCWKTWFPLEFIFSFGSLLMGKC